MKLPSLGTQCLLALGLGIVFGVIAAPSWVEFVIPIGEAFIKLLQMLVLPLTMSTIISSLCGQESISDLGKLSLKTFFWFLVTAFLATLVALGVGLWLEPGAGQLLPTQELASWHAREFPGFSQLFLDIVPGNLFSTFSGLNVLPAIIFSLLFGAALNLSTQPGSTLRVFFEEFRDTMFLLTRWIIRVSPIAVFSLIAPLSAQYGIEGIMPLVWFIVTIYVACLGQLIIYALLILFFAGIGPWTFYSAIWPMIVMAFSTSSSMATLPVTMTTLRDRLKLPERIVSFIAPLGATMKMDGCGAIFPIIVAIFTANLFGHTLSVEQYVVLSITAVIATIGTAGIPGTASVMATVALTSIGLPLEGLAIVIGIDRIVDVMRTVVNVSGTAVCSVLTTNSYKSETFFERR